MSSKHRHGLPRKRPTNKGHEDIAEDLPTLEPADAPAAGDESIQLSCEACDEDGVDTLLTLQLPEMEKSAVADFIEGPLAGVAEQHRAALRFKTVVVDFAGEALVGSAIKGLVAEKLAVARPVKVIVRRGYGDEIVHESEMPELGVETRVDGDTTEIIVDTGELEAGDLPGMFGPFLADIAGRAAGKKIAFRFMGNAKPDSAMRENISSTLQEAEAMRVMIGARVLFDRELTNRCQVSGQGEDVLVTIDPASDPAITGEAMEIVLPDHALEFAGRVVHVQWKKPAGHGEGEHLLRIVTSFAPESVEFHNAAADSVVVWPPVIEVQAGSEPTLRVLPRGRDHSAVLEALPRELADLAEEIRGKSVTIDWPSLFVIDQDTERCLSDAMADDGPSHVFCTVGGKDREPFLPPPVKLTEGEQCLMTIDTDAGRPAELVRAVERCVPRFGDRLGDRSVRVQIVGSAPASRTLLHSVLEMIAEAGPSRLEVEDHGPIDVIWPPMLIVSRSGEREARIEVDLGGRDEAQQELALKREFDGAGLPKEAVVTLVTSSLDDMLLAALIEHHAESVNLDDGTQLYPEPLPEPELLAPETMAEDPIDASGSGGAVRVLGYNREAVPPTIMLGVDAGTDGLHLNKIEHELVSHLPRFQRCAVMVVLQHEGQDVPIRRSDAMVELLRRVLPAGAAATMVFRGPDDQGRPHFQVLHSSLRAMPTGGLFRDPRARA